MPDRKTWFITGASSGIGRAIAEAALRRGDRVAATVRSPATLDPLVERHGGEVLQVLVADVREEAAVVMAVAAAVTAFGRLDVVVNNAGYAMSGAIEELTTAEWEAQFAVNVLGAATVTRAVLPQLREQRAGHIVNVTSIGGLVGMAGAGAYCASKFALEGLSEALAEEVAPLGIDVTAVEPENVRTDFAGRSIAFARDRNDAYAGTAGRARDSIKELHGAQDGDPERAAQAVLVLVDSPDPPRHLLLGTDAVELAKSAAAERQAEHAAWHRLADIAYAERPSRG